MAAPQAPEQPDRSTISLQARDLLARSSHGALATILRDGGHPYASLVAIATDTDGMPLLLISALAVHTQNARIDSRASLLVTAPGDDDPLTQARLTVIGRLTTIDDADARQRYFARHPGAERYAGFADFAFWRLEIEAGHWVGGFGRILPLRRDDLVAPR